MNEYNNNSEPQNSLFRGLGGIEPPLGGRGCVIMGIIFDLDGTLLDSVADIANANNSVLQKMGLPTHTIEKYIEFIGNGARRLVEMALPIEWQNDAEKIDEYLAYYKAAYKDAIVNKSKLFDGIPELLSFLNEKQIPISINTNKPHDQTILIANKLLADYNFEIIIGQNDDFPRKPDPSGALWIAEKLGYAPDEVLFIGDSGVDVNTAINAGMQLVCVNWGYSPKQEMLDAGCKHFVSTAQELKEFIEERIN